MLVAITRDVSSSIGQCELTYAPRVDINFDIAHAQHQQYVKALADLGCEVVSLPPEPELPDSVFVEDTAIVLAEIAVVGRPGVESRRPETASIARVLQAYRQLAFIESPGVLEGGDVLCVGKTVYVGLSGRTSLSGIDQLSALIGQYGYSVKPVELNGCLHLKSAVSRVATDTFLINPRWVAVAEFSGFNLIEVEREEPYGANALLVGDVLIYPASFPRTRRRLEDRSIAVAAIDVSELQKAEGAVTCCSLVFESRPSADDRGM